MPRKHIHKPGTAFRRNYPMERLERALEAVINENISFGQAEERFGVPRVTIWRKYRGMTMDKLGRPTILTPLEEKSIVDALLVAAKYGYPFQKQDLKLYIKQYLDRKGVELKCFRNNMPGDEWVHNFEQRRSELTRRNCENMKRVKAALTPDIIRSYFTELQRSMEDVPPQNMINYDETNVSDDPGRTKIFVRKGCKHPTRIMDSSKTSHSLMFAISGDGKMLPPYIVYKAKNLYPEWIEGGPEGCRYNRSKSGWFDSEIFEDWYFNIALPYFRRKEGKKLLIGDNLISHLLLKIIQSCEENEIAYVFLPTNSTHLCQPLDVSVFGPMKKAWRKTLTDWKTKNKGVVPKTEFLGLINKMLLAMQPALESNIKNGFASCGIIPLHPERVIKKVIPQGHSVQLDNVDKGALINSFNEVMASKTTEPETRSRKRQKKINVSAGKSVSVADFKTTANTNVTIETNEEENSSHDIQETEETIESESIYETESTDDLNNDTDEENIEGIEKADDEETAEVERLYDEETEEIEKTDDETNVEGTKEIEKTDYRPEKLKVPFTHLNELKVNSFIIVKFVYNENTKKENAKSFLGQIIKIPSDGTIYVKFLRSHNGRRNSFVFPVVDDICMVDLEQIKFLVTKPIISRGIYIFSGDII